MTSVGVIDYGVGNLRSVANALRHVGAEPVVSDDADTLRACERIIFPGVGAFAYGKEALCAKGLHTVVLDAVASEKPLLAICVGMQLMFERSSEFGDHEGLGIVSGRIEKFQTNPADTQPLRLPNVGWLPIRPSQEAEGLAGKLLEDVTADSRFYFVHSYRAQSANPHAVATSQYGGQSFAAAVGKGTMFATQFHPEKSGPDGLKMLKKFVN
ncbi:MAG: imidazole glycerol phosphate synthase subunit HisH [Rhizobiales bacterium]|nr:imidazole glycerol phosphate synthase subunit HisH [Hyphomicrobiales bacterium]